MHFDHSKVEGTSLASAPVTFILNVLWENSVAHLPFKKISNSQMQDKRQEGLCYFCDEKWQQVDKCVKLRLYLLD